MTNVADTIWTPEHFIGGHPALDLANTVFTREASAKSNDLLNSSRDVGAWLQSSGIAIQAQAAAASSISSRSFLPNVRELREQSYGVFYALATGEQPIAMELGALFEKAGKALSMGQLRYVNLDEIPQLASFRDPDAIVALLAAVSIEGYFALPRERLRACPRCRWLFIDTSKSNRRRWCSMQTCGNREKVMRHRGVENNHN